MTKRILYNFYGFFASALVIRKKNFRQGSAQQARFECQSKKKPESSYGVFLL